MEWGEEFVVGISRKLAREGLLRMIVELRSDTLSANQSVPWSAHSGRLSCGHVHVANTAALKVTSVTMHFTAFLAISALKDDGFAGWISLAAEGREALSSGSAFCSLPALQVVKPVCVPLHFVLASRTMVFLDDIDSYDDDLYWYTIL